MLYLELHHLWVFQKKKNIHEFFSQAAIQLWSTSSDVSYPLNKQ